MGRVIVGVGPDGHFKFVKHSSSTREPVDVELFNLDHQLDFFTHLRRNIASVFLCYILSPIRNFGKDLAEREAKDLALGALLRRLRELAILHDDEYNVLQDQDIDLELRANKIFLTLEIKLGWEKFGMLVISPALNTVQEATTAILNANADWFPKWEKDHVERRKIDFRSSAFASPRFTVIPLCYKKDVVHPADRLITRPEYDEPRSAKVTAEGVWAVEVEGAFQDVDSWSPPPSSRTPGDCPSFLLFSITAYFHLEEHFSLPHAPPLDPASAAAELHKALKSLTRAIFDVPPGWMDHHKRFEGVRTGGRGEGY
ncbi:hypothetical protein BCR35DRAFT_181955 [Leucosporidium creatinivorum]|uniref:Uncharacterized protein n=1 Tax=Leucosporidium creatinivorum TaxID=106004 RepID=A0A1Y2E5G9_9BASI|nr:hypothetical protein BCR35DRAFT_181955 [Leucosporidium creatinivorum]